MFDRRSCRTTATDTAVSASSPTAKRCRLRWAGQVRRLLLARAHLLVWGALQFVAPLDQLGLCTRETASLAQSLRRAGYRLVRLLSAVRMQMAITCDMPTEHRYVGSTPVLLIRRLMPPMGVCLPEPVHGRSLSRSRGSPTVERWPISLGDWSRLGHCWRDRECIRYHAARIRHCFKGDGHSNVDLCDSCWEMVLMNFLLVLSPQYGPAEFGDYTTVSVSGGVLTVEGARLCVRRPRRRRRTHDGGLRRSISRLPGSAARRHDLGVDHLQISGRCDPCCQVP
ncbi:Uncharacterised protein [Pseudomonas aeruginosa]|nr:Uncharacterised protein [Pseudomonas aeruginosa]